MGQPWKYFPLHEIAPIERRLTVITPEAEYPQIAVRSFGRGTFHKPPMRAEEVTWQKLFMVHEHDLLVSNIKAWEGAVAVAFGDDHGRYCSHRYITCRIDHDRASPAFIDYYFKTPEAVWQLSAGSPGSADRNRTLGMKALENIKIPLPPLEEQHRIVAWLNGTQERLTQRLAVIEEQEREADAMLKAAFQRLIEDVPYHPMAEIAPLVRRPVEIDMDEEYPELGVRSFGKGTFHKPSLPGMDVGTKRLFKIQAGDLVFSNVFAWEGAIAVADERDDGRVGSHRFMTCVPHPKVATPNFLKFYFLTEKGLQKIGEASPGGAGRNRTLGLNKLDVTTVPVPPLDKQCWFDDLQSRVQKIRDLRAAIATEIDALLPSMLHRVFNGVSGQSG